MVARSKLGKKIDSQERRRHSILGAPRAPRPPPRRPSRGRLRKGDDQGAEARGLVVCLPSNVLHLMPRPDFLRPLVTEPGCKSLFEPSPDLPCPGTTEHTYSVPFSQEPEGGSPCKQGVTLPFFPHPPSLSSPPSISFPGTLPEAGARLSLPTREESLWGRLLTPTLTLGPNPPASP